MLLSRRSPQNVFLIPFAACLALTQPLTAYEAPLTPQAIHEAFVLGQRNDRATSDFLSPYLQQVKEEGILGPRIAELEMMTPFAQVVDLSRKNASFGYTEQKAAEDYHRLGDTIVVRILLMLPAAYPKPDKSALEPNSQATSPQETKDALRPENFWQNFRFSLKQRSKTIATASMQNKPIYSSATKDAPSVLDGATVWLYYDAKDVASEETTVEVVTPEAKTISAVFDLKKLR